MPKAIGRKVSDKQQVLEKPIRNRCRRSSDNGFFKQKSLKNRMFVGTSISEAFCKDVGRVLGGRNPRFSLFFVIFSKQILKDVLEGQKIEKKSVRWKSPGDFWPAGRNVRSPGER